MRKNLVCFNHKIHELAPSEKEAMYLLFCRYNSNVTLSQFYKKLTKKDYVFLLREKETLCIIGFSTLKEVVVEINGTLSKIFCSGNTVVDKVYGDQTLLETSFLKFLFIQKLKNPFSPMYWFLASKCFNTYSLMANNFKNYFPRNEMETPRKIKLLIDKVSNELHAKNYDSKKGVISKGLNEEITKPFDPKKTQLHDTKGKYFKQVNPDSNLGDELACLAKLNLFMLFSFSTKLNTKLVNNNQGDRLLTNGSIQEAN